jgi:DNA segregation ATPase FtsK/SpoIIIE, S-DNA-T family
VSPTSCHRLLLGPVRRLRWRVLFRRRWAGLAEACGLAVRPPGVADRERVALTKPRLTRVSCSGPRVSLWVRPLLGQTVETFLDAAERLRMGVGATRVRVDPEGVNRVLVTFTMGDGLAEPFPAERPERGVATVPVVVQMGRCEDGSEWSLPVGPHTLVAGTSGSGKGSVFWSFVCGLAPAVRAGTVRLHGVDLKGGMEILIGAELFSSRATDASEAVGVLDALVAEMRSRTKFYAGRVRSHTATKAEPLHVVMIDELAALTAYCPERDLQRRAEMAINLLCSQGRAPGFVVFACLQDPRKEVIPSRGLFTQMVGLRLKDVSETAMVLGDSAAATGALCHRILRTHPGVGFVVPEDGGFPVRVRAGFVSDAAIRSTAHRFATASPAPMATPAAKVLESTRSTSRATAPGGREVA